ncbi:MAG: hypothetical protein GXP55_04885 [Deltaproteobacteria bacterium]|nr:hypothetical protein [Deltaproteobacteria bacterium]
MMLHDFSVALVGRRLAYNENLGLAYLRAALDEVGIASVTHYINDVAELERAAAALTENPPSVLGLSLADGGSALWPLALGELLRKRGFEGHITAGGQFATLARGWLLERYGWLDSVVRHAGEVPIVQLAQRLASQLDVADVPGVTTRAGDGRPASVLDTAPMRLVPRRDELPELLGHRACHIMASRGCKGRCFYCSPAALQNAELEEGKRGQHSLGVLRNVGVGGVRRRAMDSLADEMATLWHERDVRYFYFVDEHLLPYEEQAAIDWLGEFSAALTDRGLGAFGIGAMLRADRLTPAVCEAFRDAGLVRCFVGLELATTEEAHRFARRPPGEAELEIVRTLGELGVATVSNLMLVHPYSTPETIRAGVELLERLPAGVFEATRMMVYHGTRLHDEMAAAGRLVGNAFRYGYSYEDARMERFAEIFTRLRGEAFYSYSLAYRTHDTHLALGLARRLHPERVDQGSERRLERVRRAVNRLYADGYRRGLELALSGGGFAEARELAHELRQRADALGEDVSVVESRLLRSKNTKLQRFAPVRGAAASAISFVMMSASGCYQSHGLDSTRDGAVDASRRDASRRDASVVCTDARQREEMGEAAVVAAHADACFSGQVSIASPGAEPSVSYSPGTYGGSASWNICYSDSDSVARGERIAADVKQAISDANLVCAAGSERVEGNAQADMSRMSTAAESCLGYGSASVEIVLDDRGRVRDVRSRGGAAPDVVACVRDALRGLRFPCLASFTVCPEFAIAE